MDSSHFQALIKTLKSGNITNFVRIVDQFTNHEQNAIINSRNYNKFRGYLENAYYMAISNRLKSMRINFIKGKEEVAQLLNYSDKLGIFFNVSNIDVVGIISELHIDGLNNGLRSRIIELVSFFNEYNLFERDFTTDELQVIREIKENDKLLAVNLKDVFGKVSDSLIYYVCKVMSYDYIKWIRDMLKNPQTHEFLMPPDSLRNWTDGFSIYGLVVRNLGNVEDFITKVEVELELDDSNKDMIVLDFNPRYIYSPNENNIVRIFHEKHLVYPKNILKNKEKILDKDNYNFYSLSMVIFGGLGPEGFGFTYSTPKGEVIEVCSDQKETEAIVIQFKQYLMRKFLDKLRKEMTSLGIVSDIRNKIIQYLSDLLNPKDLISYSNKNSILRKIKSFLLQIDDFPQSKLEVIIEKISIAISIILKRIKLKDQFITRMDLVANGKLKSEDVAKLTSLRGKSHYDVLRERMFLQNKPKWFFENYPEEIAELEKQFDKLRDGFFDRRRRLRLSDLY